MSHDVESQGVEPEPKDKSEELFAIANQLEVETWSALSEAAEKINVFDLNYTYFLVLLLSE